jgi:hypothetical protein
MLKNKNYFTKGQYLFWVLILLLVSFAFFHLADNMFTEEGIVERIIDGERPPVIDTTSNFETDTTKNNKNDSILFPWKWNDFKNKYHQIEFRIHKLDLKKSENNRITSDRVDITNFNDYGNILYSKLFYHDKKLLKDLINKLKLEIKKNNLDYFDAIELVCSSIQYIPYTLILGDNGKCPCKLSFGNFSAYCRVQSDGRGCCSQILPFGVYSPLEFACLKTGDCDTRALLAYTFLKDMGFDIAVMVSEKESHSVLGIYLPNAGNYSYGTNQNGKKYALWELTSPDWRFGMGIDGDDWYAALE